MELRLIKSIFTILACSTLLVSAVSAIGLGANCDSALKERPTRIIRADYDSDGVYVYQAFTSFTADNAVKNQTFVRGQGFSFDRMTWLKLSLGWMLHRSDYAKAERQERVLRIKITHEFFRKILSQAVASHFPQKTGIERQDWAQKVKATDVIYQWDPDRDIRKRILPMSVLQLGIRGSAVREYADNAILEISDITELARKIDSDRGPGRNIESPYPEKEYPVDDSTKALLSM